MRQLRLLILGYSRVLPRPWESKNSYFQPKLLALLRAKLPDIEFNVKTIASPNKLLQTLAYDHDEIVDFFPDIIILNMNLCEFIPRSLPKEDFDRFESYALDNPIQAQKFRKFLANHRRVLHEIFGKNNWNSESGYIQQLTKELEFLSTITTKIIFLSCLDTSIESEYIRCGFQADIEKFNKISEMIIDKYGLYYLDLNPILQNMEYQIVSHDGIHYTDHGDDIIIQHLYKRQLQQVINGVLKEDFSVHFPRKPSYIQLELTNYCSVTCSMCELNHSTRSKGYMSKAVFQRIVEQLIAWQIPTIRFTLWGEALMHPQFFGFVRIAKANGLKVGFNTNGILLNEEKIEHILNSKVDEIIFSVDSFDDDAIYKLFRPSGKSIHQINNIILSLIHQKETLNLQYPTIKIQMIGSELNTSQHKKFMEYWSPLVDFCRITHLYSMKPIMDYNSSIVYMTDYFDECRYPWTTMGIYHNGDVTACCRDVDGKLKIGNIMDNDLEDIYHSISITNMRKNLIRKNKLDMPQFCQSCFKYDLIDKEY